MLKNESQGRHTLNNTTYKKWQHRIRRIINDGTYNNNECKDHKK